MSTDPCPTWGCAARGARSKPCSDSGFALSRARQGDGGRGRRRGDGAHREKIGIDGHGLLVGEWGCEISTPDKQSHARTSLCHTSRRLGSTSYRADEALVRQPARDRVRVAPDAGPARDHRGVARDRRRGAPTSRGVPSLLLASAVGPRSDGGLALPPTGAVHPRRCRSNRDRRHPRAQEGSARVRDLQPRRPGQLDAPAPSVQVWPAGWCSAYCCACHFRSGALPVLFRLYRGEGGRPGTPRRPSWRASSSTSSPRGSATALEVTIRRGHCNSTVTNGLPASIVLFGAMRPDAVLTAAPEARSPRHQGAHQAAGRGLAAPNKWPRTTPARGRP